MIEPDIFSGDFLLGNMTYSLASYLGKAFEVLRSALTVLWIMNSFSFWLEFAKMGACSSRFKVNFYIYQLSGVLFQLLCNRFSHSSAKTVKQKFLDSYNIFYKA